ncbi:MAG: diacylglycerol kinase family protein [Anaerolineae bacterium]|nr:diacylglycerol kinase family protein [Anaerolineae bacterium]
MLKEWFNNLTSTARINPEDYAAKISRNRLTSLGYALAGWYYMLRRQKNTRIMSVFSIVIMMMALWLRVSRVEVAILIMAITIVWLAEFVNAGIEAVVDLASPEIHPLAKVAKDVASAAVLLGVVASILVGLLLMGPPLLEKLGWMTSIVS